MAFYELTSINDTKADFPIALVGVSVEQQCEREWRRVVREHEQRFVEHEREHRSRLANNERTQGFGSWPTAQERVSHAAPRGMSLASSGQGRKGEIHSVG